MAVVKKKKAQEEKKVTSRRTNSQAPAKRSQEALKADEQRQKVLSRFHPDVLDWFKEKLGVDLASNEFPLSDLYKLHRGEFTEPVKVVVTPLAYDIEGKKNVEMPRIASMVSLRAILPMANGKMVGLDDKHKVFLQTVPCRPLVELAAPGEAVRAERQENFDRETSFTRPQTMALEGVGIVPERLFGGFNHLSRAEKAEILDGNVFPVYGAVKTDFGFVNVCGNARLVGDQASFEPNYPEKRVEGCVIDLESARIIGSLELEFFKRTPDNRLMKDVNGNPILNRAGENILDYGVAMEPVKGFRHTRERGKDGVWKDVVSVDYYNVIALNGSLFAQMLNEKKIKVQGKDVTVHEVPGVRFKDGAVWVAGESKPLEFRSESEKESFIRAKGGVVLGATYKDFKTQKTTVYDAFVVATESNFAQKFSPSATEKILSRREEREAKTTRRKVGFGRGL